MSEPDTGSRLDPASGDTLARVLSAARYAQVGRVADSVTHDVNNLLGAGIAYAELVSLDAGVSDDSRRMLGEIISSLLRCSTLVSGLTALTRAEAVLANAVDVNTLVRQALKFAAHSLNRARVKVEEDIPGPELTIVGDAPRLQIALLHLLTNVREALEVVDPAERRLRVSVTHDEHAVTVVLRDVAPEIPAPLRDRIFEPYFTTKPAPHLGLGLFAARQTAMMHDGALEYTPEQGFVLTLAKYPAYAKNLRKDHQHNA